MPDAHNVEPSVLAAARQALAAGAHSITVHLRADRRHIQDADVESLRAEPGMLLNFEMGNTPEIADIALRLRPDYACLVPENREEVTTEGGLDAVANKEALALLVRALEGNGTRVSLFIDPDSDQVRAAAELGASMIELHTGTFANHLPGAGREQETRRLREAAELGHSLGLQINAGHGLTVKNLPDLFTVPHLAELNIGHSLVARALSVGLEASVREMLAAMAPYPG